MPRDKSKKKKDKYEDKTPKTALIVKLIDVLMRQNKDKYPIRKHAYYKSLILDDSDMYEEQATQSRHQKKKSSSFWENYIKLGLNIKKNGYKAGANPIIIKYKHDQWYCSHGRHRICLLLYLYGPKSLLSVNVKDNVGQIMSIEKPF